MKALHDISDLKTEWIVRSSETFVHASEKSRSGWEKSYNGEYSKFLLRHTTSNIDFLKLAYKFCFNRVRSLGGGKMFTLSFHPSQSATNGKTLFVSTQVADDKSMSLPARLDVMLGLTTHEMAHCLYTDFTYKFECDFHQTLDNVIEDERIEFLIGEEFPGYATQLKETKAYYFDKQYRTKEFKTEAEILFDCVFKFIRYPKYLDDALIIEHAEFLRKAKHILTPYPKTSADTFAASCNLYHLFVEEVGKSQLPEDKTLPDFSGIAQKMNDLRSTFKNPDALQPSEEFEKDELAKDIITGNVDFSSDTKTYFIKAESNATQYKNIKTSALHDAHRLAQILSVDLSQKMITHRGMPSGVLDEAYLVEAIHGHKNVHLQRSFVEAPTANLVLMIDESGSMNGSSMRSAQKVAVTINEALSFLPGSEVYMYGYTSDDQTEDTNTITIYKEPGYNPPFSLGTMHSKNNNRDGVCIQEVTKRVRSFSKKPFLLLIISDGVPHAENYIDVDAIAHTRKMVELAAANRFIPIQIGINVEAEQQALMFKEYITYKDSTTMVKDLAKKLPSLLRRLY